jgi:hypothetical protein
MIFFGKGKWIIKPHFGLSFSKKIGHLYGKYFLNYYLIWNWGYKRWWAGYNRLERIVRGTTYKLDGKIFYHPVKSLTVNKGGQHKCRQLDNS